MITSPPVTPLEGGIYSDALCRGSLDTIVSTSQGQTFAFYGSKYWRLTDTSIAQGYPRYKARESCSCEKVLIIIYWEQCGHEKRFRLTYRKYLEK